MGNYNPEIEYTGNGGFGGGYGMGFGGGGMIILLVLVIAWVLFDRKGHHGGEGGHGGRTWFPDESNWQQSYQLEKQIQHEGAATRGLIEKNYITELRDKIAEEREKNLFLRNELLLDKKVGGIEHQLERIQCEMLKRPPVWGNGFTPTAVPIETPRRGNCDNFAFA